MAFYSKLKWTLGILLVFVLIIATNLIDRNNFVRLRDSVVTMYEDRIIANDLIFEMLEPIHQKELALLKADTTFFKANNPQINGNLQALISSFEQTKLTEKEAAIFANLKRNVNSLLASEDQLVLSNFRNTANVNRLLDAIKSNLDQLSKIQLNEGNRQMSISKQALDTVELFTQIEIYILVFLAVVIQLIVMYRPAKEG